MTPQHCSAPAEQSLLHWPQFGSVLRSVVQPPPAAGQLPASHPGCGPPPPMQVPKVLLPTVTSQVLPAAHSAQLNPHCVLLGGTHCPPQRKVFKAQVVMHFPFEQMPEPFSTLQLTPQPPQLPLSVNGSVHSAPQTTFGESQVAEHTYVAPCGSQNLLPQFTLQLPQFAMVVVCVSQPFPGWLSQSPYCESHAPMPHTSALFCSAQAACAFGGDGHALQVPEQPTLGSD
jgi:hypothetical protein